MRCCDTAAIVWAAWIVAGAARRATRWDTTVSNSFDIVRTSNDKLRREQRLPLWTVVVASVVASVASVLSAAAATGGVVVVVPLRVPLLVPLVLPSVEAAARKKLALNGTERYTG